MPLPLISSPIYLYLIHIAVVLHQMIVDQLHKQFLWYLYLFHPNLLSRWQHYLFLKKWQSCHVELLFRQYPRPVSAEFYRQDAKSLLRIPERFPLNATAFRLFKDYILFNCPIRQYIEWELFRLFYLLSTVITAQQIIRTDVIFPDPLKSVLFIQAKSD